VDMPRSNTANVIISFMMASSIHPPEWRARMLAVLVLLFSTFESTPIAGTCGNNSNLGILLRNYSNIIAK
jgi:hypothetical protein